MKKRKKAVGLAGAFLVLILLTAVYILLKNYNEDQPEQSGTEEAGVEVASFQKDDITAFSFFSEGEKLEFEKEEGKWLYVQDKEFPVDEEKLNTLLESLERIEAVRDLGQLDQLDDYGLDQPGNTISVTGKDGQESLFYIGNENGITGDYYMYMDSPQHIYTVSSTFAQTFEGSLYDYAEWESLPAITSGSVVKITVKQKERQLTLASAQDDTASWRVSDGKKEAEADDTKVSQCLSNVTGLNYNDFIDYNGKELSVYGLDTPSAEITIDYREVSQDTAESDNQTEILETQSGTEAAALSSELSQSDTAEDQSESGTAGTKTEDKQMVIFIGNQNEDGDFYVKSDKNNQVYTMSESSLSQWLDTGLEDLQKDG